MFGSKLVVMAKRFPAIHELVNDKKNGILFDTAEDLEQAIIQISEEFPSNEVIIFDYLFRHCFLRYSRT
jgi:glycosyltransferase involved in cell wall biosynthesis